MGKQYTFSFFYLFFCFLVLLVFAEDTPKEENEGDSSKEDLSVSTISKQAKVPILGFGDFVLGISRQTALEFFQKDPYPWLLLRQEEKELEVSKTVVTAYKNEYFDRFRMQFNKDEELYLLEIQISSKIFSYPEFYHYLKQKYGQPQKITYKYILWELEERELYFSRTGMVRYLSKTLMKEKNAKEKKVDAKEKSEEKAPLIKKDTRGKGEFGKEESKGEKKGEDFLKNFSDVRKLF